MGEALAAAIMLGAINTMADFLTLEMRLSAKPFYAFARILIVCKLVGTMIGSRSSQMLIGWLGGLMIGTLVGGSYYALAPSLGWNAVAISWMFFWVAFALLEAMLQGGSRAGSAFFQGIVAAALSAAMFYAITAGWREPTPRDPNYLRLVIAWTGAFIPGFVALFWNKL